MDPPVHSQSPYGMERKFPIGGSEKAPQYSDFSKVIQKEFGILNHIGILFSQSSEKTSQGDQGFDQSNDLAAKTVQPNVHKHLACASTKNIRKTG
jgi:hypothetical protein